MMERNGNVLRSVAWTEIFPWLNIFKTFRLAIGFRSLVMSALAALLTVIGWWIFGHVFSTEQTPPLGSDRMPNAPGGKLPESCPIGRSSWAVRSKPRKTSRKRSLTNLARKADSPESTNR